MEHAIVMASKDGSIVYWDDGASELFGYSQTDVMDRPVDVIVPEDLRAKHWERLPSRHGGRRTPP
jgi:PAS domain S-box-containing protein